MRPKSDVLPVVPRPSVSVFSPHKLTLQQRHMSVCLIQLATLILRAELVRGACDLLLELLNVIQKLLAARLQPSELHQDHRPSSCCWVDGMPCRCVPAATKAYRYMTVSSS